MDDLIQEFLVESNEGLDRLDTELVKLESDAPDSKELLASIFRTVHSIKGACGFLGFQKLEALAHAAENLLSKLRDRKLRITPEISTALLATVDAIRQMLNCIGSTGQDGDDNYFELVETLKRLQEDSANTEHKESSTPALEQIASSAQPHSPKAIKQSSQRGPSQKGRKKFQPQIGKLGGALIERQKVTIDDLAAALEAQESGDSRPIGEILVSLGALSPVDLNDALRLLEDSRSKLGSQDSTIRVNVNLLDRLMTLVGELVLARNQLLQFSNALTDNNFHAISQRMNLIASELQEEVMKTRMQPIGNIWSKFPRTVRDLVVSCGKDVRIEMEGKETELDKTIIEAIKDPLTHLVRNAVDHGIEMPDVRQQAGKSPTGCLTLRAFHEGGQVNIEIADDGAGLNVERIRDKAVERGLIRADQAPRMSERDIFQLIFLPGFSTAEKVTNVSGRGVGMDVVRTNIEKIGGTVEVQSIAGQGTTIRIKIPLTLAIIPALIVTCGKERYAIPQLSLLELIRLEGDQARLGIEMIHDAPVYRLRGQLLPLVYLKRELSGESGRDNSLNTEVPDFATNVNIVVLQADGQLFGLVVDAINDSEEIVVKPLRKQLKQIKTFAGASIMGDGRVALILDISGLAERAHVVSKSKEHVSLETTVDEHTTQEKQNFLVFSGPEGARMAVPLDTIARLEELPLSVIERAGSHWLAQYRGGLLPLVDLASAMQERRSRPRNLNLAGEDDAGMLPVLVCHHEGKTAGIVIEQILDIVQEASPLQYPASRPGVMYSTVIAGKVTEIIDVAAALDLINTVPLQAASAKAGS